MAASPFGTIITLGYNCTPTVASYLQIVGSDTGSRASAAVVVRRQSHRRYTRALSVPDGHLQIGSGRWHRLAVDPTEPGARPGSRERVAVHVPRARRNRIRAALALSGDRDRRRGYGGSGAGVTGAARDRGAGLRTATAAPRTLGLDVVFAPASVSWRSTKGLSGCVRFHCCHSASRRASSASASAGPPASRWRRAKSR